MTITERKNGTELTVIPVGRLDSTTSDEFQAFLNRSFTEDIRRLVIDFTDVDFISSKGLRVLVGTYKNLNGRTMTLVGTNASVQEVLRLSGLMTVFDVQ